MSKPLFKSDVPVQSLVTITQTALSCGIGLLLASKLEKKAQKNTAIAMLSIGALSTLPLVYELVARKIKGPNTERGMRKTLESIREDSGLSEEMEVI